LTQLDFKSRLAAIVAEAEQELRGVLLVAAQGVQKVNALAGPADAELKAIEVKVGDAVAFIDGFKGVINLSGAAPALTDLLQIADKLEPLVADAPSFIAKLEAGITTAEADVASAATTVEHDIEEL
jgi:hypothetical protein